MTTEAKTRKTGKNGRTRRAVLLGLAVGTALAGMVAMAAGTAREAEATFPGTNARIAFTSNRTTGTGVDNPTGDFEIFTIKPDGTGLKQLTFNTRDDNSPAFSPDGTKIAYDSNDDSASNPQGDYEIYVMNASDGSGKKNLSNNDVVDYSPVFSPDGTKIAHDSQGIQDSNPEGDYEVYVMNASDGSGKKNLSDNDKGVEDNYPVFSPDSQRIVYTSFGIQTSNPQGDYEIYRVNALDGLGQKNLSNNGVDVNDRAAAFSPDGTKIAYQSNGAQPSNLQGDYEVYRMSASDGLGKKNLSNNGGVVDDFGPVVSHGGKRIAYTSSGKQTSNPQGDIEVYRMNATDGKGKKNLSNNGVDVNDRAAAFSPDGTKIAYQSNGAQPSNLQGDYEIYRMNASDGLGKKNLTNNGTSDYLPDWGRQAM